MCGARGLLARRKFWNGSVTGTSIDAKRRVLRERIDSSSRRAVESRYRRSLATDHARAPNRLQQPNLSDGEPASGDKQKDERDFPHIER
jgi:hypothetical protein